MLHKLIEFLYPRRCPVCGDIVVPGGELICPDCAKKLSFTREPVCMRCGKEVSSDTAEYCFDCTKHRRSFESGRALLNYNEAARRSMAAIKYGNKREYLDFYGAAVCARFRENILRMGAQALVPVPVHPSRKRRRGFNQAELLAENIGSRLGIPVEPDLLFRVRKTAPQKELGPRERLKNLEKAFAAGRIPEGLSSVILVDDIYTTGSTIEACARVLKKAGIKKVYFLTICIGRGS